MKNLWTVFRFEVTLSWRGRMRWVIALFAALVGVVILINMYNMYPILWQISTILFGWLTLFLSFTFGGEIHRDQERRMDGIIMGTPVTTRTYVLGKYLAGLLTVFIHATTALLVMLLLALSPLNIRNSYPPFSLMMLLLLWLMLVPVPLVCTAALTMMAITLTRGQRVLTSIGITGIWIFSFFFASSLPPILNLPYTTIGNPDGTDSSLVLFHSRPLLEGGSEITPEMLKQAAHLYETVFIPEHLGLVFLLNRSFFLALSALFLIGTVYGVHFQRGGKL